MNKISKVMMCFLMVTLIVVPFSSIENFVSKVELETTIVNTDVLDGGWLEERDGIKILHVSGSNYEMGYQHGYLLKDEIEKNYRAVFSLSDQEIYDFVLREWNEVISHYVPQEYIEEMQGLADGSGKSFDDVAVFVYGWRYFFDELPTSCMEMSAWGPATKDGKLRHFYSLDWHLNAKDSESDTYLQENQLIIVRKPENRFASLQSYYAGTFAGCGGINDQAIATSLDASGSTEFSLKAPFYWYRLLMVLDYASTAEVAIDIMISGRNGRMNYVISDGKVPVAFVIEETVNYSYVGTWDDDVESISPFWSIDHVVRRKNMFIHPETSATQRPFYDPRIFYLNSRYTGGDYFNTWRYYKTLSEEVEKLWGTLDNSNIISMARSIYRAETDIILNLYGLMGLEPFSSFHQWVVCPETGDITVSYATGEHQAQYNDLNYFNLYDLIEAEPP